MYEYVETRHRFKMVEAISTTNEFDQDFPSCVQTLLKLIIELGCYHSHTRKRNLFSSP